MPAPSPPDIALDWRSFSESEIANVIKQMKVQSVSSPFDGYVIFKRCPSLIPALAHLFNSYWDQSAIPSEWKCAAIKLIPKSSASDDNTNPANFRPIALTPCVGKHPAQKSLAEVHDQSIPGSIPSEGIHAHSPRLHRAPSQAVLYLS